MVAEFEPIGDPDAFHASNIIKDKPHGVFQVPQDRWKALQSEFHPVPTRRVTQEDIQRVNEAEAIRVAKITQQYARKGKAQIPPSFPRGEVSTTQVSKNPPPPLLPFPVPIQCKPSRFLLENELSKIRILVPLR
jgi:hypothetical protein